MSDPTTEFSGVTYDPVRDHARLKSQLERVKKFMADGQWRTLAVIAEAVGGSEAGVSARLRDLRKLKHGSHTIERRNIGGGAWMYRMTGDNHD